MLKAYKYSIYPNKEQETQIAKTFGCCRFVYNQTLAYRKERYEKEKKTVSKTAECKSDHAEKRGQYNQQNQNTYRCDRCGTGRTAVFPGIFFHNERSLSLSSR